MLVIYEKVTQQAPKPRAVPHTTCLYINPCIRHDVRLRHLWVEGGIGGVCLRLHLERVFADRICV